ncbi:hypothetical protein [Brumicola nitratireducens]|uniref:Uncharacterized protein n=1 Tax=Glaciecola nitratireducens (strain JCM 12485 / KCTC 12276 / FR1064) TaxID=1085623 RepID=G4QL01_GLANF|nr:hypothetical protein [Glaciecola nitratireducens]AEP29391.1 hypothetical protein GNIT_1267 [Glaciecola nitratireducens FR1064]
MNVINDIIAVIEEHKYCSSSELLAEALASFCSPAYNVNLLEICKKLDGSNKDLVNRLINVTYGWLPDFKAQDEALRWLKKEKFIK